MCAQPTDELVLLGTFEIKSDSVRVSDPCYDLDTWCAGVIGNVQTGTWKAYVQHVSKSDWGRRCAQLIAIHAESVDLDKTQIEWTPRTFEVGVDSGQAGIFDVAHYRDDTVPEFKLFTPGVGRLCSEEPWYSLCCDRTLGATGAGVIPFGCVSSSGFGDGGYVCETFSETGGKVRAIRIVFIGMGDGEEEDNNEDDKT